MQQRLRREGFEAVQTPEAAYKEMVDGAIPKGLAALITHNGSGVIPPVERPSINDIPNAAPLNDFERAVFEGEIVAGFNQTAPDVSYPTVPSIATIEDPTPADLSPEFDLTESSQHGYAEFLGTK